MALERCGLNVDRAGRELQPHGSAEFPCAAFAAWYGDGAGETVPWHWHEELEILYAASGCLELRLPGRAVILREGEGYVISAKRLHAARGRPRCDLRSLVFHPRLVTGGGGTVFASRYMDPLLNCPSFDGCGLERPLGTGEFLTAFHALCRDEPGHEFVVREALSRLCLALYRRYEGELAAGSAPPDRDGARARAMIDCIHARFNEGLGLAQIAGAANIGQRECLRCFQRVMGISPMQYLLKHRVERGAALLLSRPESSVAEIAGQCGFESPSSFSKMFRRHYLCSPREYRSGSRKPPAPRAAEKRHRIE